VLRFSAMSRSLVSPSRFGHPASRARQCSRHRTGAAYPGSVPARREAGIPQLGDLLARSWGPSRRGRVLRSRGQKIAAREPRSRPGFSAPGELLQGYTSAVDGDRP
jgi:hypothetical protein